MKPVKYQYINDAGWDNYAESIATKPENIDASTRDCFKKLVPIIQQASVDYLTDPAATNTIILDAVDRVRQRLGVHARAWPTTRVETMIKRRPGRQRSRRRRSASSTSTGSTT